jgi:glutamate 5-kinase
MTRPLPSPLAGEGHDAGNFESLEMTDALAPYRRLTIKIGSALLVDGKKGELRAEWLAALAEDIAALKARGVSIVIVSSGAIALGRQLLHLDAKTLPLDQSQAAASAGQIALSQAWASALGAHGIITGQILLTPNITEERRYFLNARTTISTLLGLGAIPIINENDSVATTEIRYGDNDRLSARVATMIEADCLVLLSDVDGLYTAPPAKDPNAAHLAHVAEITPEIDAMAGGAASHLSRGGMTTKVEAGKIATKAGTAMIIAKGTEMHPLMALTDGARHTLFAPAESRAQARKRWIMGTLELSGAVHIDAGAAKALLDGRSLLPIGVTRVTGEFNRGDAIAILSPDGREVARGLAGLGREEADLVKGKKSEVVTQLLGIGTRSEMVHRDNLVILMGLEARV